MKIIYAILVVILLLIAGNWYYAANMPVTEEVVNDEPQDTNEKNLIYAVDPKSGISFNYPEELGSNFVSTTEWPPRFINSHDPIKCELDEQTQAMSGSTSSRQTINGNVYCIWETKEVAESEYITYQIIYPKDDQYIMMSFTLQYRQCENYPAEQISDCRKEQSDFPLTPAIDTIAQSAQLPSYAEILNLLQTNGWYWKET